MPLFPRKIAARIERTAEIHTPDGLIRTRVAAGGLDTAPAAPMSAGLTDQDRTLIHS